MDSNPKDTQRDGLPLGMLSVGVSRIWVGTGKLLSTIPSLARSVTPTTIQADFKAVGFERAGAMKSTISKLLSVQLLPEIGAIRPGKLSNPNLGVAGRWCI